MKSLLKVFVMLSWLTGLTILSNGCIKVDNLPQLEVKVVDQNGSAVSGAFVALFDSESEWASRENPVQAWRKTDAAGKVLFVDLSEKQYFIYVRFDGMDNSLDEISPADPLKVNFRSTLTVHIR